MEIAFNHSWDLSPSEAIKLQKILAQKVEICELNSPRYICGIDCAPSSDKTYYFAAAVIWDILNRQMLEYHIAKAELTFPYIPGLLSFREIPAIIEVIKKIQQTPDIIMVDGHGIAHPRGFGIASHVGVLTDKPTFGCGKSLLFGKYNEPGQEKGSISLLMNKNIVIGHVIRTRSNVKPVIVSVGHKTNLKAISELTLKCSGKFRLPEPTRLADLLVAQKEITSVLVENDLLNI